ncbi:type II toxin-antitoxin system VapC family toxin [Acinetobacter sp. NIPH 298]|uniref:type II toxin-antitoxin system VapC family toxin n=1 Tax=Acinetobacter sp. NIPH 298 TaxID=1217692 RepID=UPI0002CED4C7|nr:type II toxin-antitoxin system VapC family toxin [Acinetobacter sp. NIPH 298]ENW95646.1 hypothetical protein F903_01407 [Acinetobacter sp. NIPH 298]
MIVLDTNIISEMMKPEPNPTVRTWLNEQVIETLYLSSVTIAELQFGIGVLAEGRRKQALTSLLAQIVPLFEQRILAFDFKAAEHYAKLAVEARLAGKGFPTPDGYIAAIASSRGFMIATRDIAPFKAVGLAVINPFE